MLKIYVCSPLRGDIETNLDNAVTYSRLVIRSGHIPITPHLYLSRVLDDNNPAERLKGLQIGAELLRECNQVWVFGNYISDGMKSEISLAESLGIVVVYQFPEYEIVRRLEVE